MVDYRMEEREEKKDNKPMSKKDRTERARKEGTENPNEQR